MLELVELLSFPGASEASKDGGGGGHRLPGALLDIEKGT